MFVHQLFWSDDEHDVPFGDTLCDVVGPDVLSDNDIAANFTNDNNDFVYTNDFSDRNQAPNPDIGLNLQDRKS